MSKQKSNLLRIIGGEHRGRKLPFPDAPGLRPTPDRVRETLFNWLMPVIAGSRCLDLFAGSGALGLEAISRGARQVVMLDNQPSVAKQLRKNLQTLNIEHAEVVQADGLAYLDKTGSVFDIVFLDPPYQEDLLPACITHLETRGWLARHAWIYLEVAKQDGLPDLPVNWKVHRRKEAGQVAYHLIERSG